MMSPCAYFTARAVSVAHRYLGESQDTENDCRKGFCGETSGMFR